MIFNGRKTNYRCNKYGKLFAVWAVFCFFLPLSVQAQMFGDQFDGDDPLESLPTAQKPAIRTPQPTTAAPQLPQAAKPVTARPTPANAPAAATNAAASQNQPENLPVAYQYRIVNNQKVLDLRPKIFLSYRDFKISRNLSNMVVCNMRFFVLSTFPQKINNISYRLKWPNMETALSFNNVEPNVATYYDYALLGNGCYDMDKAPNVIVNRCRIKGMSSQECANAIRWVE